MTHTPAIRTAEDWIYEGRISASDARLIAAAPELLVALEEAIAFANGTDDGDRYALLDKLRSVVILAKGGNQ